MTPAATAVGMHGHGRGRKSNQRKNKSRGEVGQTYCKLCLYRAEDSAEFDIHVNQCKRHLYNYFLYLFKEHRVRKSKDRHGVKVEMFCGDKELRSTRDGTVKTNMDPKSEKLEYKFVVKNTGGRSGTPVMLRNVFLLHPYKAFSIHDAKNVSKEKCQMQIFPGNSYAVSVKFKNYGIGSYGVPVCFVLDREDKPDQDTTFYIIRLMVVNVIESESNTVEEENEKVSPFTGEIWLGMEVVIPGRMPDGRPIRRLEEYAIPEDLFVLLQRNLIPYPEMESYLLDILHFTLKLINDPFPEDPNRYADLFHSLLFLEEFAETRQIEQYNMADVPVKIINETRIELEVPGLAEKRPSVLKGDLIYLRVSYGKEQVENMQYEGIVSEVRDSVVWIGGFDESFMERLIENPLLHFDVHFTISRFSLFVMHRAIDLFVDEEFLEPVFPSGQQYPPLPLNGKIEFINKLIESNPEQATAVKNIVLGTSRPAPYIIHGPPGTGKTMTVVEAILQVKKVIPKSYILVCAAANSACDLLAQKLVPYCTTKELLRLHSSSRDWETVPAELHKYSNRNKEIFWFPSEHQILEFRIIVCTLISAGRLLPKRQPDDDDFAGFSHFTHVFIDECGQAQEPATLVPIAGILGRPKNSKPGGQIILAGDPLQLGPVCAFKHTGTNSIGKSLIERLMEDCELYGREENANGEHYDNKYITKLCRNYRSHELILRLPNECFYDGDLISKCGDDVTHDKVKNLEKKPEVNLPIVFHGVLGQEKREGRSPSYYNIPEIQQVVRYVTILLADGPNREKVKQNEIGIIAPYIRQVYRLKAKMKENNWDEIEVGTTETFQGREKRVIIISTVRGNKNLLDFDGRYRLGFVADPKRFNVAVTRARSLLIVVGNPFLLAEDEYWNKLLQFTNELGSYRGCLYVSRRAPEWTEYVKKKFSSLKTLEWDANKN